MIMRFAGRSIARSAHRVGPATGDLPFAAGLTLSLVICATGLAATPATAPATRPVSVIGQVTHPPIIECSGLAASRRFPGVFWIHNDGGSAPAVYAITREGRLLAEFPVAAENIDWEDLAIDDSGRLYLGDIGNNGSRRKTLLVHRIREPDPRGPAVKLTPDRTWTLAFPADPFDCEALFVFGQRGYVISKLFTGGRAAIYSFPLDTAEKTVTLARVATVPIRVPVTGADISADGRRLAILTVTGLNVFAIDGDIAGVGKRTPVFIPYLHPNNEACCFAGQDVLCIPETRQVLLFRVP